MTSFFPRSPLYAGSETCGDLADVSTMWYPPNHLSSQHQGASSTTSSTSASASTSTSTAYSQAGDFPPSPHESFVYEPFGFGPTHGQEYLHHYPPSTGFRSPGLSEGWYRPGSSQTQAGWSEPHGQPHCLTLNRVERDHTRYVALSCSVVPYPSDPLAPLQLNICVVDYDGNPLYNVLVEEGQNPVFQQVQDTVRRLLDGKIIIGHSLWHDFRLLDIHHSTLDTRDHAVFLPFRRTLDDIGYIAAARSSMGPSTNTKSSERTALEQDEGVVTAPLPILLRAFMQRKIGREGYPLPIEDARACMDLFRTFEDTWEEEVEDGSWPCALPSPEFREWFL